MTYEGLSNISDDDAPHLGGNIDEGDPLTFAPSVWDYLIDRFAVKSVLDLGSGLGYSSHYFFKHGLQVIAVEGLRQNVEKSLYPSVCLDLTKSSVLCKVDLVHCQEFVEHIEERFIENVLNSLKCGKIICMTHALPGQGGYHHVNEQSQEYWVSNLRKSNFDILFEDTKRIRYLAAKDNAMYLAKTGLVASNKSR